MIVGLHVKKKAKEDMSKALAYSHRTVNYN